MMGTALWGWGVDQKTAHAMLDGFALAGGKWIDAAVNYPINGNAQDFGRANEIITSWLKGNPNSGMKVFCKIGAVDNSGEDRSNLGSAAIRTTTDILRGNFSEALKGIGIHWDNRDDIFAIQETVSAMEALHNEGYLIGFSGVRRPDRYAEASPDLARHWWIQIKENASTKAARQHYFPHFPDARYIAYSVNMGGVKMDHRKSEKSSLALRNISEPEIASRLRAFLTDKHTFNPCPRTMNELAILMIFMNRALAGLITGPRTAEQLCETLAFWQQLNEDAVGEKLHQNKSLKALMALSDS
ncbi:MAG: oxidoreductase [Rhodospirillaceae bacterium]|nr:oxidoreductase [Rhodospirillaceae bacterium]MBT5050276.1 oxidoreductase [Rhodospirillaceae bacterium]